MRTEPGQDRKFGSIKTRMKVGLFERMLSTVTRGARGFSTETLDRRKTALIAKNKKSLIITGVAIRRKDF